MLTRPLLAPHMTGLMVCLFLLAVGLAYLRLSPKPLTANPPIAPVSPTPALPTATPTASDIPVEASPAAMLVSPTPAPIIHNSRTGWQIYTNPHWGFSFEFPPTWNLSEFSTAPQPIVLVGTGKKQDLVAFTITLAEWPLDTGIQSASGSAWTYDGWHGKLIQTKQNNLPLTIVTATKTNPGGQELRLTWLRSLGQGNPYTIDAYLKPILKTFHFL